MSLKNTLFISLLSIVLFSSCSEKKEKKDFYNSKKLVINEKRERPIQEEFTLTKNIILEDNEEGRFTEINKLKIKKNTIYILDIFGQQQLFVFDINGKFIRKIGKRGNGPGEYNRLCDFDVDDRGNIYLYNAQHKKMLIYDSIGSLIKEVSMPYRGDGFNLLGNGGYIFSVYRENDLEGSPKVIVTDSLFNITKKYFSYSKDCLDNKGNTDMFRECSRGLLYNKPTDETVFLFDKSNGEIIESFYVDFGSEALPQKYKDDYALYSQEKKTKNRYYSYMYNSPLLISNRIIGNVFSGNNKALMVYNLKKGKSFLQKFDMNSISVKNLYEPLYTLNDSTIVSYLDNQVYALAKDNATLGDDIKKHVGIGGYVLSLFTLK